MTILNTSISFESQSSSQTLKRKDDEPKCKMFSRLLEIKSSNHVPRLSSGPNDVIEFDLSTGKQNHEIGLLNLMQRFIKHSTATPRSNTKTKVDIK